MKLSEFDFDLPESFIAQDPANPRDAAKMLVLDRSNLKVLHKHFYDLPSFLREGDVLVLNNSKVIPARISFDSKEIFLLGKSIDGVFECMVRPGRHFKVGTNFDVGNGVFAKVIDVLDDGTRLISFVDLDGVVCLDDEVFLLGETPLPPYIKHSHSGFSDYQTVYAKDSGSVAAPTAGLHFTSELLSKLREMGVQIEEVMLHVSRGTFATVKSENIEDHNMHSEFFSISRDVATRLNKAKSYGRRIIAVGTTSVRVLESSFIDGKFKAMTSETSIFIHPGYKWKAVDALVTNFHLPKSTLLMLVSSFAGKNFIMRSYETAKKNNYRFFSFGDAMLIF